MSEIISTLLIIITNFFIVLGLSKRNYRFIILAVIILITFFLINHNLNNIATIPIIAFSLSIIFFYFTGSIIFNIIKSFNVELANKFKIDKISIFILFFLAPSMMTISQLILIWRKV
jgi:hypothetical protein